MSHTRGPWRVVDRPSRGIQVEWGGDADGQERPICHMRWTDGLLADVNARVAADARLIAAAPRLLTALQDLLDAIPDDTLLADPPLAAWCDIARSVIAETRS